MFNNGWSSPGFASSKENNRSFKQPTGHFSEASQLPLGNAKALSYTASPRPATAFTRLSRCLSRATAKLRSMGCMQAEPYSHNPRERIPRSPGSAFSSAEKVPRASNCSDEISYRSSFTLTGTPVTLTKRISSDSRSFRQQPGMSTGVPSTNSAYKECHLFSPESLQLAAALLGTMEPLILRSVSHSIDDWGSNIRCASPSRGWIHRNTTIRPGYCVQIPTVHDRSCSYMLSGENEESKWSDATDVSEPLGGYSCPKLFVAHQAAELGAVAKAGTRAFIMRNPVEGTPHSQC